MTADKLELIRQQSMEQYGFGPTAMKKVKVCTVCGNPSPSDQQFCTECGHRLPGKTFKCWKIGTKEYKPGDKITVEGDVTVKAVWKAKTTTDLDYVPATGDNFPILLWAGLLLFSMVALVEVAVRRKRN